MGWHGSNRDPQPAVDLVKPLQVKLLPYIGGIETRNGQIVGSGAVGRRQERSKLFVGRKRVDIAAGFPREGRDGRRWRLFVQLISSTVESQTHPKFLVAFLVFIFLVSIG